jgi:hypothetical protein
MTEEQYIKGLDDLRNFVQGVVFRLDELERTIHAKKPDGAVVLYLVDTGGGVRGTTDPCGNPDERRPDHSGRGDAADHPAGDPADEVSFERWNSKTGKTFRG